MSLYWVKSPFNCRDSASLMSGQATIIMSSHFKRVVLGNGVVKHWIWLPAWLSHSVRRILCWTSGSDRYLQAVSHQGPTFVESFGGASFQTQIYQATLHSGGGGLTEPSLLFCTVQAPSVQWALPGCEARTLPQGSKVVSPPLPGAAFGTRHPDPKIHLPGILAWHIQIFSGFCPWVHIRKTSFKMRRALFNVGLAAIWVIQWWYWACW
jgi:hypothetical protein